MGGTHAELGRGAELPATLTGWTERILKQEFDRGGPVQHLLLRYTQALITQVTQTAV